eukprot:scaffold193015_cov23-Prasinocladus_malaysianus.AAC.1
MGGTVLFAGLVRLQAPQESDCLLRPPAQDPGGVLPGRAGCQLRSVPGAPGGMGLQHVEQIQRHAGGWHATDHPSSTINAHFDVYVHRIIFIS